MSIFSSDKVICGKISKDDFVELVTTNVDFKSRLYRTINSYKDKYFKFLLTMVRNVFAFRQIPTETLRNVVYKLKEKSAHKGSIILRTGESSN